MWGRHSPTYLPKASQKLVLSEATPTPSTPTSSPSPVSYPPPFPLYLHPVPTQLHHPHPSRRLPPGSPDGWAVTGQGCRYKDPALGVGWPSFPRSFSRLALSGHLGSLGLGSEHGGARQGPHPARPHGPWVLTWEAAWLHFVRMNRRDRPTHRRAGDCLLRTHWPEVSRKFASFSLTLSSKHIRRIPGTQKSLPRTVSRR